MDNNQEQKADAGKSDPALLEHDFVNQLAVVNAVLDYGVAKYGKRGGWREVEPERYKSAVARHKRAVLRGEVLDEESGLPHWAHVITNELFLAYFEMQGLDLDDCKSMCEFNPPPPINSGRGSPFPVFRWHPIITSIEGESNDS